MADILIKGMEMPDKMHTIDTCRDANGVLQANCGDGTGWHDVVEVPTHGRLIDANELYKKTAELEAKALHLMETHLHDEDIGEWRKWSTVLTERSAFKYDIADAETVIEASEDGGEDETAEADYEWSEEEQAYIEQGYIDTQVGLPDLYMN